MIKESIPTQIKWPIKLTLGHLSSLCYDLNRTLVISGAPRSGTTWLAEILNTIPRSSILYEPIYAHLDPTLRKIGFRWQTYIAPGSDWPEAEQFLKRVLAGKTLTKKTLSQTRLGQLCRTRLWIIKFIRANMLIKWLTEKFVIPTPILIIRHPCAVVASRLRHHRLSQVSPLDCPEFHTVHPEFADLLTHLDTPEEMLTAEWCLEYYATLSLPKPHPWRLVTYEKLVCDGDRELDRIFSTWSMDVPAEARLRLSRPSSSTTTASNIYQGKDPLSGWTEALTPDQVQRILTLVKAFSLDFYGEALEPDYDRLESPMD